MASQQTIDRINNAIAALGETKNLLLRGNADQPDAQDLRDVRTRMRTVGRAMDEICFAYDAADFSFEEAVNDAGFSRALREIEDDDPVANRGDWQFHQAHDR